MKLKKIASLALAGIMAVSMLAGCSTTSVNPEPNPNPGDGEPTVSGYSQMLYNHLTNAAKKKVTPQDSNDVNDALAAAMKYAAGNTIAGSYDDYIDAVAAHPRLAGLPFVLETPNDDAGWAGEIAMLRAVAGE